MVSKIATYSSQSRWPCSEFPYKPAPIIKVFQGIEVRTPYIRFDIGPSGVPEEFSGASAVLCARTPEEVPDVLRQMEEARRGGAWLAGYASYELGYALERKLAALMPADRRVPLIQFGIFDAPVVASDLPDFDDATTAFQPKWTRQQYTDAFKVVAECIVSGDFYQANLTFPLEATVAGDILGYYAALAERQATPYGAYVDFGEGVKILSRSPELFFEIYKGGAIQTRPMKGTAPRDADPVVDCALAEGLATDEKNRAENLMIVDLLRNDLSRVCEAGSVKVPKLFEIETYTTVHQMVSRIEGQLRAETNVSDLFCALFPCGSITGAPKIRAMEVLNELEPEPRDVYCGAIGWMAPDGSSRFSVAIRTVMVFDESRAVLNVGGGVVYDSTAASEYEEALWKARFANLSPKT